MVYYYPGNIVAQNTEYCTLVSLRMATCQVTFFGKIFTLIS